MKRFVIAILLLAGAVAIGCLKSSAQTRLEDEPILKHRDVVGEPGGTNDVVGGIGMQVLQFLSQGTNWSVGTYGIYDAGSKSFGGGVGAFYEVTPVLLTGMRLDYVNHDIWVPSGQLQLQIPFTLFNSLKATPLAFSGIATAASGKGSENGTVVGIFGAGMAINVYKGLNFIGDVEKWTGGAFTGLQYRFGLAWKF